jgi:hypothetical protein
VLLSSVSHALAGAGRAERSVEVYGTRAVFTVGTRW